MARINELVTKRRIEFADVDQAGLVHFARFFVFMETAEHEFLRSLGTSVHTKWNGMDIGWPRLKASCEYFKPVHFEDELQITVRVQRKGTKSMTYSFEFRRGQELMAQGVMTSACCILNAEDGIMKAIPIPDFIADQISE